MKNMTELETLLRSLKPRPPRRAVKERIFGAGAAEPELSGVQADGTATLNPVPFRLGWLAPATVTFLLTCVLFSHHNAFVLGQTPAGTALIAAAVSNQNAAAWLPGSFEASHNTPPIDAFDWTRGQSLASNFSTGSRP